MNQENTKEFKNDDEEDLWKECVTASISSNSPTTSLRSIANNSVQVADMVIAEFRKRYKNDDD